MLKTRAGARMSHLPPPSEPLSYATYLPPPKPRPTSVTVIAILGFNLIVINPRVQRVTQAALNSSPVLKTPTMKMIMQYSMYGGICFGVVLLIWPMSILYVMTRPHVKSAFERGTQAKPG
jgi:hypothetical protein